MSPVLVPSVTAARPQTNLPATPSISVPGTQTTGGASNTKGSYSTLIDPVTFDSYMLMLLIKGTVTAVTRTDNLVDIAIGPTGGGSEQIIVPNLLAGWQPDDNRAGGHELYLPIYIPRGVRVSARSQGVIASDTVDIICYLMGGFSNPPWPFYAGCDVFGATGSGSSAGTSITPGATGTEGSWTNVGSATARPYKAILFLQQGNLADTTMLNSAKHYEVGYSSGVPTLGEWWALNTTNEDAMTFPQMPFPCSIPSGVQLQVRAESDSADVEPKDVAVYCFY